MSSRESERRKKNDSKYRQVLFQNFVQRRSEKLGGRWRGSGVTGDFFPFNVAYIIAYAYADGCDLVLSKGVKYHL